jgi:peptidoglycan-associated lipoprotein
MLAKTLILGATLAATFPAVGSAELVTQPNASRKEGAKETTPAPSRVLTPGPSLGEVNFEFDSAALAANAPDLLADVVSYAGAHPSDWIVLDAHCDPIGTSPYNVGLAIRRAESVRHQLETMGVSNDRLVFAIYGKDGERRARYADDRRVTLWTTRQSLAVLITHTFDKAGTAVSWRRPMTMQQIEAAPVSIAAR